MSCAPRWVAAGRWPTGRTCVVARQGGTPTLLAIDNPLNVGGSCRPARVAGPRCGRPGSKVSAHSHGTGVSWPPPHAPTWTRGREGTMALTAIPATSAPVRPRTLLVDADRAFAELLAGALPRVGMTWVGTAHSAKDGIALSRRLQPDVVTLDLDLPAQDGLSAARRIRAVAPQSVIAV